MKKVLFIFFITMGILCILITLFQLLVKDYPKYWWYAPLFFLFAYLAKEYEFPNKKNKENNKENDK